LSSTCMCNFYVTVFSMQHRPRVQPSGTNAWSLCQNFLNDWPFSFWSFWCQESYCMLAVWGIKEGIWSYPVAHVFLVI
jgi:hypothetical protein